MLNEIDEYALLLARYGEPNKVVVTPSTSVSLRTAIYYTAHLRLLFVPCGCVHDYERDESRKANSNARTEKSSSQRSRSGRSKPVYTTCVPPANNGSTIIRYEDDENGSSISADDAKQRLDRIRSKLSSSPVLATSVDSSKGLDASRSNSQISLQSSSVHFDQETLHSEQARLAANEFAHVRDLREGIGLLFGGIGLLIGGAFVGESCRARRMTRLVYELNEVERQNHSVVEQSLKHLAGSQKIWRVVAKSPTYDWKHDAGAAYLVRRTPAAVCTSAPPRVASNVAINCIDLGTTRLYFLPDMVLYWESGTFGAIAYDDLRVEQRLTTFIEEGRVPDDARQVDHTWRHVRKDGGPDRRFNNNFRIPVMEYGSISLTSSKGLNILLNVSNVDASAGFVNCLLEFQDRRRVKGAPEQSISPLHVNALKILGLQPGASLDNISDAYRRLAQMYHPDKVVGLAPEFHEIAERRMKEINAAYQVLRRAR
jgi:hypothetical protein